MNPALRSIVAACCVVVALVPFAHGEGGLAFETSPVPLTIRAQKDAGVPGGEGYQLVMTIAYAASDPDRVYLGSDTSQVWRSDDGGRSWRPANGGYHALGSRSLLVHPGNPDLVLSAGSLGKTFERAGKKDAHQGIYRSVDGGAHWTLVEETGFYKQQSRGPLFAIDSNTLDGENFTVYAGSFSHGLLVSRDGGISWDKAGFNQGIIHALVESPAAPGTLLIATDAGLFEFDGESSREVGQGLAVWPRSLAVSADRPELVYAALGPEGLYRSTDGGRTFRRGSSFTYLFGEVNDVAVSNLDANIAIATKSGKGAGPYYTADGGVTWRRARSITSRGLSRDSGFLFPAPIAMHPTDRQVALTSANGKARVLASEDGGRNWFFSNSGYRGGRLRDVVFLSPQEMIFGLTDHGAWRTVDGAEVFSPLDHPRTTGRSIGGGAQSGKTLVLSIGGWKTKSLVVSRDNGKAWSVTPVKGRLRFVDNNASQPGVIYAGRYRSDDSGLSWQELEHDIIAMAPGANDTVFAVMDLEQGSTLLQSDDRGDNWRRFGAPLPISAGAINGAAIGPGGRVFLATARGVFTGSGGQWRRRAGPDGLEADAFGGDFVDSVAVHTSIEGLVFAGKRAPGKGMANGLFYSADHGDSWSPVDEQNLGNMNIWSVNVNPFDGVVYVGTSHGSYRVAVRQPGADR